MATGSQKVCPKCGTRYDRMALFCQKDGGALINPDLVRDPYVGKVLLEQFRIEKLVGQGGMGAVYRARQTTIGRDVAIKILHPELTTNPDAVRRFQREARVSAALDHPNVVRVFLFGQLPDGSLYIVMQYLHGRSLLEVEEQEAPLPPSRALHIVTQICDGVGEAHTQGVIHRDVKPENVILVQRGQDPDFVKVLDFGIARFISNDQTVATQSGLIFGTARYISPEGAAGEPTDARSDVYSIGILLYQLLTGHTPFEGQSPIALLMNHVNDPAPDIRGQPGGSALPGSVCDVVMRTLTKNAEGRFDDANELAAALRNAAMMDGVVVAPPRLSALPSRPSGATPTPAGRHQASVQPTPVTAPIADGFERARDPFVDSARQQVPGLRGGSLRSARTLLAAALVGAVVVVLGAFAWQPLIDALVGDEDSEDLEDLEERARAALSRGDFEEPASDNVLGLTDRLLEAEPDHAGALGLRRDVAQRLRQEGEEELSQGSLSEARDRYRRALIFLPEDGESLRALADLDALEAAPMPEPVPELRAVPRAPTVRASTTFFVTLVEEPPADAEPGFDISRVNASGHRHVTARPDGDRLHWVASYTFRRAGAHRVVFSAGDLELVHELEVTGRAQASHEPHDSPPTVQQNVPVGTSGSPTVTVDDGIDWRLPDEHRPTSNEAPAPAPAPLPSPDPEPPPPSMTTTPPAPWTSGSL